MIAINLIEVKNFMNLLFTSEIFDNFLVSEATIINGITYSVDGHVNRESENDLRDDYPYGLASYGKIRPRLLKLISGNHTPEYIKFVLTLSPDNIERTLESIHSSLTEKDISGMYLNIIYQKQKLTVTTGLSYRIFTKDKALEQEWDRFVQLFLKKNNIYFETL